MEDLEPKKLALLRIEQILKRYSDFDHPLTQEEIAGHLEQDYGIVLERKAVSRNLSLLREAGLEIGTKRGGNYLETREFEDAELRMLIDGVLSSRYITARHSKELIEQLCGLSNQYFRAHVRHICSVDDWSKTDNQALFFNIELVDEAIGNKRQIAFDFNCYGVDKKLHKTASHTASPYQMLLHSQRYYLMALNEKWKNMAFYRMDHITNMRILTDTPLTDLHSVPGYENGIDYKDLACARPHLFNDKAQRVELLAADWMIDRIIEWFGTGVQMERAGENKVRVTLKASPAAMEIWALQYIDCVEVTKPAGLREKIRADLAKGQAAYAEP